MANVVLRVDGGTITPVGELSVKLTPHLERADSIAFQTTYGTPVNLGQSAEVTIDGTTFGPFVIDTVNINEPMATGTQARDVVEDASILNDIIRTHIYSRTARQTRPSNDPDFPERRLPSQELTDNPLGVWPDPARQAFLAATPFTEGYSVDEIANNDIKSQTRLTDAIHAARRQLFEVVQSPGRPGYTLTNVYSANEAAIPSTIREILPSELVGTIRRRARWDAFDTGAITEQTIIKALERTRATYRTPNDDRDRSTPSMLDAYAIDGDFTSIMLAADAIVRHILRQAEDTSRIDISTRLDVSLSQGRIIEFDSQLWRIKTVTHKALGLTTDVSLERVDLLTEDAVALTYATAREYMSPRRARNLAQGQAEGNVTQAVWDQPKFALSDGTQIDADNITGYQITRWINTAIDVSSWIPYREPDDESAATRQPQSGDKTNVEYHAVEGRNAQALIGVPAGRTYPIEVRTYNDFGLSRVGLVAETTPIPQRTVALSTLLNADPARRLESPDMGTDAVLILRTVNGFPILPTRSTVWGYTEFAKAYQDERLDAIPASRVFQKEDRDFTEDEVPAQYRSKQIILTPTTGFSVRGAGVILGVSSVATAGVTGFIGTQSVFTCSAVCVPMVQAFTEGAATAQRLSNLSTSPLVGPIRAVALNKAYLISSGEAFGFGTGAAGRLGLAIGSSARFATPLLAAARIGSLFGGPVGWGLSIATLPLTGFLNAAGKQGNYSQFLVDPNGWVFERVELQYQWRRSDGMIISQLGGQQPTTDESMHWNVYSFETGQQNTLGTQAIAAINGAEMDWFNKDIPATDDELLEVLKNEVGVPLDFTAPIHNRAEEAERQRQRQTVETLFWMRRATQQFNHKNAYDESDFPSPRTPYDVRYRIRLVVDSQPGTSKAGTDWNGSGARARTAYTQKDAEDNDWLITEGQDAGDVKASEYSRLRYRASPWHTTDWIPFNRPFTRNGIRNLPLE